METISNVHLISHNNDCGACDTQIEEYSEVLFCASCETWFHNACNYKPLKRRLYILLKSAPTISWFCDRCLYLVNLEKRTNKKPKVCKKTNQNDSNDSGCDDGDENSNPLEEVGQAKRLRGRPKNNKNNRKHSISKEYKRRDKREIDEDISKNNYICEVCDKHFISEGNLKKHRVTHSVEKPFKCIECDKQFSQKAHLERHSLHHQSVKPFMCEHCGKDFITKNEIEKHMVVHTEEKPFTCLTCDFRCNREGNLKQHMKTHTDQKPFECDQCHTKFRQNWYLKVHMKTHSGGKRFECIECGKKFLVSSGLKSHMANHHSGEKPYECLTCGYKCHLKSLMKIHKYKHTDDKPYVCSVCNYKFAIKSNYKKHLLTHSDEKPYQCEICGKGFAHKNTLRSHKLTHTGEKPHQCDICSKSFRTRQNLRVHMFSHTGEKRFFCPHCGKGFPTKDKFKQHLNVHTRENNFACEICGNRYTNKGNLTKHKCGGGKHESQISISKNSDFETHKYVSNLASESITQRSAISNPYIELSNNNTNSTNSKITDSNVSLPENAYMTKQNIHLIHSASSQTELATNTTNSDQYIISTSSQPNFPNISTFTTSSDNQCRLPKSTARSGSTNDSHYNVLPNISAMDSRTNVDPIKMVLDFPAVDTLNIQNNPNTIHSIQQHSDIKYNIRQELSIQPNTHSFISPTMVMDGRRPIIGLEDADNQIVEQCTIEQTYYSDNIVK